ncbi:membrane protein, major facilitator superfamily [Citrifermentans bemidjiense Bem]|uniref:Membrane protein, major facilitator superfamily n=1 Tax=Citrifermentans bemidjiense (strain ATCC BAA-1014 / DSM 16622 / JCM 12645 / Bem) TaxID=404380 RepID=B5EGB2_CITBB|nr:MFS transporter [Citrifermentans bemidjiense]ACH41025.1 membrane protein, major facilitator superfamily [Citrifermentans bemidjiense Bem]
MKNGNLFKSLFLINFSTSLGFGIADAFFSTYLFSLGGRGILLGLPLLLFSLSKILFGPVMGACVDRFGPRAAVTLSLTLYLLVSLGYLFSSDLALITLLRLVQGVACAMFRPVMLSLVGAASGTRGEGRAAGTFDISFYLAIGVGPLLGGVLHDRWGFYGIFSCLALLCLLALTVALRGIPRLCGTAIPAGKQTVRAALPAALEAARHRPMRGLLVFIFGRGCGISLLAGFLPILLNARLGLNGTQTGLVLASSTLVITSLLRPVGRLSDRLPRKSLVLLGGVSVSLLYFLIPVAQGFHQVLMLGGGIGLCSVLSQPASTALLLEQGERHGTGLAVGIFNTSLNLGFVAGPLLGGWLQDRFGLTAVFYAAGWIGLAAVGLFAASNAAREKKSCIGSPC